MGFWVHLPLLYTRISVDHSEQIALRLTLEKDPGEAFEWNPSINTPGFDHLTGALQYRSTKNVIRSVILGDFAFTAGQGLLFWRNTGRGKGTSPLQDPLRKSAGARPVASREENAFFRGISLALQPTNHFDIHAFYSIRNLDASLRPMSDSLDYYLSSRSGNGLHRTPLEIARKDAFQERLWGGAAIFNTRNATLGISGYFSRFSHPYVKGDGPQSRYDFTGSGLKGIGLNGRVKLGTVTRGLPR